MSEEEEQFFEPFELELVGGTQKPLEYIQEGDDALVLSLTLLESDGKKVDVYAQFKDYKSDGSLEDAKIVTMKNLVKSLTEVGKEEETNLFLQYSMKPIFIVEGNGKVKIKGIFADKGMIDMNDEEEEDLIEEEDDEEEEKGKEQAEAKND